MLDPFHSEPRASLDSFRKRATTQSNRTSVLTSQLLSNLSPCPPRHDTSSLAPTSLMAPTLSYVHRQNRETSALGSVPLSPESNSCLLSKQGHGVVIQQYVRSKRVVQLWACMSPVEQFFPRRRLLTRIDHKAGIPISHWACHLRVVQFH